MARTKGKPAAAANAAIADAVNTSTPDVFSPGADWRSIKGAAEYLGYDDPATKGAARVRNAIKGNELFKAPGALRAITLEGMDIPPIVYIAVSALDAFKAAISTSGGAGKRGPRGDTRRAIIDVPHAKRDEVVAALAALGIEMRDPPKGGRKPKAAAAGDGDAPIGSDGVVSDGASAEHTSNGAADDNGVSFAAEAADRVEY